MKSHPLHKLIGDNMACGFGDNVEVVRDPACGGEQHIPLFCNNQRSRKTHYSNVDLLILQNCMVRLIIEIEESDITPVRLCGKFLAAALCSHFIHNNQSDEPIPMSAPIAFIQVVDASKLKSDRTAKLQHFQNIAESIQDVLPLKNSSISSYRLFAWKPSDKKAFLECLHKYVAENLYV